MADSYDITGQSPTSTMQAGGTVTPAMQVEFTTKPSGVLGRITVPMSAYTPTEVDKLIRGQVSVIEAVQAL